VPSRRNGRHLKRRRLRKRAHGSQGVAAHTPRGCADYAINTQSKPELLATVVEPHVEDGEALFAAVCERGFQGVVAKRERDPYRPGERQWG